MGDEGGAEEEDASDEMSLVRAMTPFHLFRRAILTKRAPSCLLVPATFVSSGILFALHL